MLGFTIIVPVPLIFAAGIGITLVAWIVHMVAQRRNRETLREEILFVAQQRSDFRRAFMRAEASEEKEDLNKTLGDEWLLLYRQLREVTGNTIRYNIVRKFCYHIEEKPSSCGGTYETAGIKRDLPHLSLQGVQQILKAFPDCNQRGYVECILAKFMTIDIPGRHDHV